MTLWDQSGALLEQLEVHQQGSAACPSGAESSRGGRGGGSSVAIVLEEAGDGEELAQMEAAGDQEVDSRAGRRLQEVRRGNPGHAWLAFCRLPACLSLRQPCVGTAKGICPPLVRPA